MSEQTDMDRAWEELQTPSGLVAQYFGGQIVMRANPTALHDMIIRNATRQDYPGVEAWGKRGIDLGPDGRPRPDLVYIAPEDIDLTVRDWPTPVLQAVAEVVSPSSARDDWHTKRDLYARHGIPVYVIVDPRDATCRSSSLSRVLMPTRATASSGRRSSRTFQPERSASTHAGGGLIPKLSAAAGCE